MTALIIPNKAVRALWLWTNGLAGTPTGPLDVMAIIRQLGFVQLDTIRNVTRAHNHIIWTRNQNFTEGGLWPLLARDRLLFEHFTHDASLIMREVYPYWQGRFSKLGDQFARYDWYKTELARDQVAAIRDRIAREGPLSTHAFNTKIEGPREMWARPPHKKALDQMWYAGELSTSHRENFVKFYDLGERIFPSVPGGFPSPKQASDWLNHQALHRLSFANPGEIQRFWDANDAVNVRKWIAETKDLVPVEIEAADGSRSPAFAPADIEARLAKCPPVTTRLRIINPFDPAIRDRLRLGRLFGFEYRNEMFVPKAKRIWGYYVYPLLEGTRFVGRIELKADRKTSCVSVTGFWPEPGVKWTTTRTGKLTAELLRFSGFAGNKHVIWQVKQPD